MNCLWNKVTVANKFTFSIINRHWNSIDTLATKQNLKRRMARHLLIGTQKPGNLNREKVVDYKYMHRAHEVF